MLNQDMDVMTMVDVMKANGDLYVDVIENVQCVLNSSVRSFVHSSFNRVKW